MGCRVRSAVMHQVGCIRKMTDTRKRSLRGFSGLAGSHMIGYIGSAVRVGAGSLPGH